jgi:hypothetical protein
VLASDVQTLALASRGDAIHLAWRTGDDESVWYARPDGAGFAVEPVDAEVSTIPTGVSLAIAVDGDGRPNLAYSIDESTIAWSVRTGSGWARTATAGLWWGNDGDAALAIAAGRVHLAYLHTFALQVADEVGGEWAEQTVSARCTGDTLVDAAFDAAGALHVVYSCPRGDGIYHLRRSAERYPDDHAERCAALATSLRDIACGCAADSRSDCCIAYTVGDREGSDCSASVGALGIAAAFVCGDATAAPAQLEACAAAATALTCRADGTDGVVDLPDACDPAW